MMIKKWITVLTAAFAAICFTTVVMAEETGNKRKGKYTYRKVYKACYQRGEIDSPKPPLNPDSKTQAAWKTVFENKNFDAFGCSEEWGKLSDTQLLDIFSYLHAHAADSPTPLKCK